MPDMAAPFVGSEATAAGRLTYGELTTGHSRVFRDVYLHRHIEANAVDRAKAAWLWSKRQGVVAGFSASALHGSDWVDAQRPAELIHSNRHRLPGLLIRGDELRPDEIEFIEGVPVTTPARTAVDLACWYRTVEAVAAIDALMRATSVKDVDVQTVLARSRGRRGVVRARESLDLIDAGAQSPKESWLRVILIQDGLPRPVTQIPVYDGYWKPFALLDMGWPEVKVAAEYDGDIHRSDAVRWRSDAKRHERLQRCGWTVIRVLAGDRDGDVIARVRAALARRT